MFAYVIIRDYIYSSASVYADEEGLLEIIPVMFKWKTVK